MQVAPLTSQVYLDVQKAKLLKGHDPKRVVLTCELTASNKTLSTNTHYFALPKEMALPKANISATWQQTTDSTYQVTLKSKALAREVWLSLSQDDGFFDDNYFDLLPGQTKTLTFKSEGTTSLAELRKHPLPSKLWPTLSKPPSGLLRPPQLLLHTPYRCPPSSLLLTSKNYTPFATASSPAFVGAAALLAACQRTGLPTSAATASTPVANSGGGHAYGPAVEPSCGEATARDDAGGENRQMTQITNAAINHTGEQKDVSLDSAKLVPFIREYGVGSFLNGEAVPPAQWLRTLTALQRIAMRESRLHVPIIYGIDHMHGASYVSGAAIFPHNINLGATFNPEFARQEARATVMESADLGTFGCLRPCSTWA